MLSHTKRITLQLSNRCNYAAIHPRCPVGQFSDLQILPTRIIHDVIGTLYKWDFGSRMVAFHVYNEPGIDPRLLSLIKDVRGNLPESRIHLWTNGWYLDLELLCEMREAGVSMFTISAYGKAETERLTEIRRQARRRRRSRIRILSEQALDDRTEILTEPTDRGRPCHAPLMDLTIRASGQIGLCCNDFHEAMTFGNLHDESFAEAMVKAKPHMDQIRKELLRGKRLLPVCQVCRTRRYSI